MSHDRKISSKVHEYYRTFYELLQARNFVETTEDQLNYHLRHTPSSKMLPRLGINLWLWNRRIRPRQTYMSVWLSMTGFRVPSFEKGDRWQYNPDLRWHFIYRDLAHPMPPANTLRRGDPMPPMHDFIERWGVELMILEGILDGRRWDPEFIEPPGLGNALPRTVN